ncbi:MAG: hypothetical protein LBH76_00950 [Propionibacteriaceae bacterium]|nr:hypothetical protein [Propionibacteriaceae bacterium]
MQTLAGTTQALADVGVRDTSNITSRLFPNMPLVSRRWVQMSAYFKGEDNGLYNIGLGRGRALDVFNDNLVSFGRVS